MTEHSHGYAVFLHEQAIEVLGEPINPHLRDGPGGRHIACREVDTAGAFVEMTLDATTASGEPAELQLMIPTGMIRMIVSTQSDLAFGFADRRAKSRSLPVVGPHAPAADAPSEALPDDGSVTAAPVAADDRRLPPEG